MDTIKNSEALVRSINAYSAEIYSLPDKTISKDKITECIELTSEKLKITDSEVVKTLIDKFLTVHLYVENIDSYMQLYFKLSIDFINFCEDKGWKIIGYLGEGGEADVYRVVSKNKVEGALVLQSNVNNYDVYYDRSNLYKTLLRHQRANTAISKTFVDIYDTLYYEYPYSTNKIYVDNTLHNFRHRPILVLEVISYTVEEYIKKLNKTELRNFSSIFVPKYNELLKIIAKSGFVYHDTKGDNTGLIINGADFQVKFIDIGSFAEEKDRIKIEKWLSEKTIKNVDDMRYYLDM